MDGEKLRKQLTEFENEMYAIVFPLLSSYETRGYNAHQRSQTIARNARLECERWIDIQKKSYAQEMKNGKPE